MLFVDHLQVDVQKDMELGSRDNLINIHSLARAVVSIVYMGGSCFSLCLAVYL